MDRLTPSLSLPISISTSFTLQFIDGSDWSCKLLLGGSAKEDRPRTRLHVPDTTDHYTSQARGVEIASLSFIPNSYVAAGGTNGCVYLWDIASFSNNEDVNVLTLSSPSKLLRPPSSPLRNTLSPVGSHIPEASPTKPTKRHNSDITGLKAKQKWPTPPQRNPMFLSEDEFRLPCLKNLPCHHFGWCYLRRVCNFSENTTSPSPSPSASSSPSRSPSHAQSGGLNTFSFFVFTRFMLILLSILRHNWNLSHFKIFTLITYLCCSPFVSPIDAEDSLEHGDRKLPSEQPIAVIKGYEDDTVVTQVPCASKTSTLSVPLSVSFLSFAFNFSP